MGLGVCWEHWGFKAVWVQGVEVLGIVWDRCLQESIVVATEMGGESKTLLYLRRAPILELRLRRCVHALQAAGRGESHLWCLEHPMYLCHRVTNVRTVLIPSGASFTPVR